MVTSCQVKIIRSHGVKNVTMKVFGLDGAIHVFRPDLRKEREKMALKHLVNDPNKKLKLVKNRCQFAGIVFTSYSLHYGLAILIVKRPHSRSICFAILH